jgi:hypothetical protein
LIQNELSTLNRLIQSPIPKLPNISSKDYIPSDVYYKINSKLLNNLNKLIIAHPEVRNNISEYLKNASSNLGNSRGMEYLWKAYFIYYMNTMPKDKDNNISYINNLLDKIYYQILDIYSKYSEKLNLAPNNYSPQSCLILITIDSTLGSSLDTVKSDKNILNLNNFNNLGNKIQIIHDIYYNDLPRILTNIQALNYTISELPTNLLSCYKTIDYIYNKLLNYIQNLLKNIKPPNSFIALHNYNLSIAGVELAKEYYPYDKISAIENLLYSLIRLLSLNDLALLTKGSEYNQAVNNTNVDASLLYNSYINTISYVRSALNYINSSDIFLKYLIIWLINYDIIGKLVTFKNAIKEWITYGNLSSIADLKRPLTVSYIMGFGTAEILSRHLIDLINILKEMFP